ncbi:hypothetical protein D9M72_490320 [compost metagenome]
MGACGKGVRLRIVGNGLQLRLDGACGRGVVGLERQAAAQQGDAVALASAQRSEVGLQLLQVAPQLLGAQRVELQVCPRDAQPKVRLQLFLRQPSHEVAELGELTARKQLHRAGLQ